MNDARKAEILEALIEKTIINDLRVRSQEAFKRDLGNFAKKTGFSEVELREVIEPIIRKLLDEMLAR